MTETWHWETTKGSIETMADVNYTTLYVLDTAVDLIPNFIWMMSVIMVVFVVISTLFSIVKESAEGSEANEERQEQKHTPIEDTINFERNKENVDMDFDYSIDTSDNLFD